MSWRSLLKNASVGILAMGAVQLVQRRQRQAHPRPLDQALDFALGGVLGAAYSRLIPWEEWGVESGVAFAQLPVILSFAGMRPHQRDTADRFGEKSQIAMQAAELALWGALTGLAMKAMGDAPGEEHAEQKLIKMPLRGR